MWPQKRGEQPLTILAVIVGLVLLGAFWRYALKGAAVVIAGGVVLAALVLLVMLSISVWDRVVVQPRERAQRDAENAEFCRKHPDFKPPPKEAKGWTPEQFEYVGMPPCPK